MKTMLKSEGTPLGLADDDGEVDAEGESDAEAEAEGERDAEGLSDGDAEALIDALTLDDGDTLGLMDGDSEDEGESEAEGDGLTDADGLTDGEPIAPTAMLAHTFTPLVASLKVEKVWTQNSYSPTASAGHRNRASLSVSGNSLAGERVCTPPGSVTYNLAYCPPGA